MYKHCNIVPSQTSRAATVATVASPPSSVRVSAVRYPPLVSLVSLADAIARRSVSTARRFSSIITVIRYSKSLLACATRARSLIVRCALFRIAPASRALFSIDPGASTHDRSAST